MTDNKLKSLIKNPPKPSGGKPKPLPLHQLSSSSKDLWNFADTDDFDDMAANLDARLGALVGGDDNNEEQAKIDEEAFLADFADDDDDDSEIYFSDEDEYEMLYSHPDRWQSPKDILQLNSGMDHFFTDELRE